MGMFDTVWARCPKCDTRLGIQSKAGKCLLKDYSSDNVPATVAQDVQGDKVWCEKCDQAYRVRSEPIRRVRVFLIPDTGDDEEDDQYD